MFKWFGNDTNGFSIADLEKIILSGIFSISGLTACYVYIFKSLADMNFLYFVIGIGALMVGRKGLKYWQDIKTNNTTVNQQSTIATETDLNQGI